jgi:hypothetical protein
MDGLFTQALAAFQGFFSRGFWFGSFLPVAMFAAVNLFLAWLSGFDWAAQAIGDAKTTNWAWAVPLAAALIVLAYALAPLVPVCRAILDGSRLPTQVFEWLRGEAYDRRNAAYARLMETGQYQLRTNKLRALIRIRLPAARQVGNALGVANLKTSVWFAALAVRFLERRVASGNLPNRLTLWIVVGAAAFALNTNAAAQSGILGGLEGRILDALDKADENARDRFQRLLQQHNKLPPEPQPTRAGEARNLSELYSRRVYDVEFAFIWPRVQMVIKDDDPSTKRIEAARALADFSVLSLMLAVATLVVWLPLLALTQKEPWSFLGLGIAGPLLVRFFYQLVIESQISLGEAAQGIVDRFRFDVLKMLHIKPPATLAAEREIWSTMAAIARGERPAGDVVWTVPPT